GSGLPVFLALSKLDQCRQAVGRVPAPDVSRLQSDFKANLAASSRFDGDYDAKAAAAAVGGVRSALRECADRHCASVSIPTAYLKLAERVRTMRGELASKSQDPVVDKARFLEEVAPLFAADLSERDRAMEYLCAVGDLWQHSRVAFVVLDPIR